MILCIHNYSRRFFSSFHFLAVSLLCASPLAFADFTQDQAAIRRMKGCYEVTFHFKETSENPISKEYNTRALEWVTEIPTPETTNDNEIRISLQHILFFPQGRGPTIKHWKQAWTYEPRRVLSYSGFNEWTFGTITKRNERWSQEVFQVDDSPRYGGLAEWIHDEQGSSWKSAGWSPLPRREESRKDYQVLARDNTHFIPNGSEDWFHHQSNAKLWLNPNPPGHFYDGKPAEERFRVVGTETGKDTYKRIPDEMCQPAQAYWEKNQATWLEIQKAWDEVYSTHSTLKLHESLDGKKLWEALTDYSANPNPNVQAGALELIQKYIRN